MRRVDFGRVYRRPQMRAGVGKRGKKVTMSASKLAKELVENVRPRFWRKHAKLFWFLLLGSVAMAVYIFIFYSRFFLVNEIEVIRHDLTIDRNAVESEIAYIYGENIFTIDTERLQVKLADKFPALAYASVRKVYPRRIEIEVDSFGDALIARDTMGVNYMVNEVGMITEVGVSEFNLPIIKFVDNERIRNWEEAQMATEDEEISWPDGETVVEENVSTEEVSVTAEEAPSDTASETNEAELSGEIVAEGEVDKGGEAKTMYEIGEMIISQGQLGVLLEVRDQFEREFGLKVDSLEYYPVEREMHLIVAAAYPYAVKVDFISPIEEQFEKLRVMAQEFDLRSAPLEYVDLRVVGNKIFYMPLETN